MLPDDLSFIENVDALRAIHHPPMSRATDKVLTRLDEHCRAIIALSPFCIIATQGEGGADVTPRGDPAGFVSVLDDEHVLLPDRVGNNRFDTMENLLQNPVIGMIFLVPGMNETLRINGTARITNDARVLEACAVNGRVPKVGLLVHVKEAFMHCPKAFIRSRLWDADSQIDRAELPSYAEILLDHCKDKGLTEQENERQGEVMAKRGLY